MPAGIRYSSDVTRGRGESRHGTGANRDQFPLSSACLPLSLFRTPELLDDADPFFVALPILVSTNLLFTYFPLMGTESF